ncbi:MAG: hypothetical protein KGK03_10900 [Candidatus Omnitrophica bacterium]|nr:hypothetical protein [Candidatus Omnitrophota bacterium]MDE2223564.1 hypothetical protein [Candidatus Omnitrophota bacterium]
MKRTLLSLVFLGLFASGCTVYQINSKDMSQDYYPPKTSIDQVTYIQNTNKPYTQIGVVSVTTERIQPFSDVVPKLKQEAGMLGADAITDVQNDATAFWKRLKPQRLIGNAYIRTTYTAKAIVWK